VILKLENNIRYKINRYAQKNHRRSFVSVTLTPPERIYLFVGAWVMGDQCGGARNLGRWGVKARRWDGAVAGASARLSSAFGVAPLVATPMVHGHIVDSAFRAETPRRGASAYCRDR
jgi:hypothetical protein